MPGRGADNSNLAAEDVRRLLLGEAPSSLVSRPTGSPGKVLHRLARYSRCSRCHEVGDGLLTLHGRMDFTAGRRHPEAFAAAVDGLRLKLGRRVILLCQWCADELDESDPFLTTQTTLEV